MRGAYETPHDHVLDIWIDRCHGVPSICSCGPYERTDRELPSDGRITPLPYLVEAADGTVLQTSEDRLPRAESTARVYASEKGVETRVTEWRETEQGYKSREVWCASDYPATVRFPAGA